jgi:hypothetical protein
MGRVAGNCILSKYMARIQNVYLGLLSPYNMYIRRVHIYVYDFEKGEPYIRIYT